MDNQGDLRVLFIGRDDSVRSAVSGAFQKDTVRTVYTLTEAVELVKEGCFDCILLDAFFEDHKVLFVEDLKGGWDRGVPIILLTDPTSESIGRAEKSCFADFLAKDDLTPALLKQAVYSAIRFRKMEAAWADQIQHLQSGNLQLKETNARLEALAYLDPLTEILNRRGFQQVLSRECQQAQREGQYFIVLLIDLDNFKQINDSMGYDAGDSILKEIAKRLRAKLRATDYVARIGGDEFMVLLPKTRPAEGLEVAHKIRLAIAEAILLRTGTISVTLSIGLAMVTEPIRSLNELLAKTHVALVKSKELGKNQVTCDTPEEDKQWQKKKLFAQGLDLLRQGEELSVIRQPIFRFDPMQIVGYEFFSRSPMSGFEMPEDFFHVASEANMLAYLDRICFEKCIRETLLCNPSLQYHINIFPSTLLALPMEDILGVFPPNLPREQYCLELSEKWFVGNPVDFVKVIHRLRSEGIRIAIDDVGFGQTFLESLILLSPDFIKIDPSCTNGIAKSEAKYRSLERLLKIIKTLGAAIMVKGIESGEDLVLLRELGITLGQGHFFTAMVRSEGNGSI